MHCQPNMAWTNEDTFKFIELYQSKPIIWNPRNKKHTDRNLVDEAWGRISDALDIPVSVLKRKKKTLMTTFRFHYKKKQQTLRRYKVGSKHIYTPMWAFYEPLESFLKGVYEHKSGKKLKVKKSKIKKEVEPDDSSELQKPLEEIRKQKLKMLQRRSNYSLEVKEASREVSSAFHILNRIFKDKQKHCEEKKQDECALYGRLLAKKLRQFSETERQDIMYELDGLLINRCLRRSPSSPHLQVIIRENGNSASDSLQSSVHSPTHPSQETPGHSNTPRELPESLQTQVDPLQSSSHNSPDMKSEVV
ncbi:uncharacterized protein [Epargyreus clarus]|uniref:uncharacterized protein n=1 Tax=Epargyreus clarus TaxID=520877 RepID=UPI003C2D34B1